MGKGLARVLGIAGILILTAAAFQSAPSTGMAVGWKYDEPAGPVAGDSAGTNDHEEGFLDGRCGCGSTGIPRPTVLLLVAAGLLLALRRR